MKRLGWVAVVAGLSLFWASLAQAQATWTGSTPATWNTGTFWSTGSVPTASTAVVFTPSANATMNIPNGVIATATSINFANTAGTTTISIANGGRLNVGGAITDSTGASATRIDVVNSTEANAASILTASSIAADNINFNSGGAQFLTMNADVSLATALTVGNASGTATYRQAGGTLTTTNGGYGLTLIEATSANPVGTATFILDGGRVMSDRIGVANANGNNGSNTRYAATGSFVFNSGTVQPRPGGVTFFQNGAARTSGTTTDTQYDTSKPVTISLAGTGVHEFNATGGNIFITPSAQLRDKAGEAGTLLKTGTSSLILTGNGPVAINDWTGASTVNAGTLSVDYNQIAGTATSGSTTALSNAYSLASQLVMNGGNFLLNGRPNVTASSQTGRSMNAGVYTLAVTSTAGMVVGQAVTNPNLPAGTYIRRITNATTVELNAMITGTTNVTGQTFDFAAANFTNSQTINSVSLQQSGTVTVNPAGDSTVLTFGTVAGTAGFTKAGAGLLVLSGSNTFSGGATLSAGTLVLNNASALGTGTFTISGGTIDNTSPGAVALTQANPQAWNADFTFAGTQNLDLGTGAVTLSANRQVTTTAGVLTVGGAIGGAFTLTKAGAGTLQLTGSSGYTGLTTVSAGTLALAGAGALISSGSVSLTSADATLDISGVDGSGISLGSLTSATSSLVVLGGKTITIANASAGSFAGVLSGSGGSLTKSGAGTLTLSGSSTYTGKTTVTGGGISINSIGNVDGGASALGNPDSVANGTIDLAGTLTYTGATAATDRRLNVGNGANSAGIINAGAGRLTLDGPLAVNVTSAWEMNSTGVGSEILVNGLVSGNGANGLFVNGASGTVTLANSNNSFSGPLQLYQGTVSIVSIANSGSNSSLGAGSSLAFGNSGFNMTGRLRFTGSAGGASNRTITISAGPGFTNGGILENAVAGQTLTLSGNVTATGSTPSLQVVGAGDGVLSGNISDGAGDLSITKNGAGTWTLSGSNSYSGVTTVSQGTLRFGSVNSIASSSGASVASGALLAYSGASSGTLALSINGAGGFTQSGAGTLALSGSNGFTGATSLNAGTLALASANALAGTGTMSFGGGTLQYGAANQTDFSSIIRSSTGAIAINTNSQTVVFANTLDTSNTGGLSKSGAGTLRLTNATPGYSGMTTISAGTLEFAPSSGSTTLGGSVVGALSGTLLKTGAGTMILSGTGNTFAGSLSVTGGTFQIGNSTTTNIAMQGLAAVTSVNVGAGANLVFKNSSAINSGAPITLSGTISTDAAGVSGGGFITQLGALAMSGGSLIANVGANNTTFQSYALGGDVTVTGASPSTISVAAGSTQNGVHLAWVTGSTRVFNVADVTSSAVADLSVSAPLINATSGLAASGVRKTGAGTMLISSTSTYSGATQVAAGTLLVNGRLANTSGVTVDAGATLGGSGVISALATVNGTLSPGNSPGEITLSSLALGSSATTLIEITGTSRSSEYDGITILTNDGLTYGGALSFDFGSLFGDNTTFDIFRFTGTPAGGFTSVASTGSYAGTWTNNNNGTYSLQQGSQTLTFSQLSGDVVIVPEPTTLMLAGIGAGLGGVAAWRRRRASAARR